MKIGIDLDHTITANSQSIEFFKILTHLLFPKNKIFIITNREPGTEQGIAQKLNNLEIQYHHIVITDKKAEFISDNGITIFFENEDEYFLELGEEVVVFKIRESGNYSFAERKWITSKRNSILIDE